MKNSYIAKKHWNRIENEMAQSASSNIEFSDLIDFGYGDPDFTTDKRITQKAFVDALSGHTHYTEDVGYLELREEISKFYSQEFNYNITTKEIMVTTSSAHGMWLALSGILDPGDEVIIPSPHYSAYPGQVEIAGGKPIFLPMYEDEDFQLNIERLESLITNRTKAIIINTPHNPTGSTLSNRTLEDLADICDKYDLLIIADDIYTIYNYQDKFIPITTISNLKKRTITLGSFSKDFAMTGWRVGYILAEDYMIDLFKYINEYNVYTAPSISQRAALHGLRMRHAIQPKLREEFKKRLYYGYDRLNNIKNIKITRPKGAFYLFPNIKATGLSSREVAKVLLEEGHISVIPGTAFGEAGAGYIRLACTIDIDKMREGFNRMERLSIFKS